MKSQRVDKVGVGGEVSWNYDPVAGTYVWPSLPRRGSAWTCWLAKCSVCEPRVPGGTVGQVVTAALPAVYTQGQWETGKKEDAGALQPQMSPIYFYHVPLSWPWARSFALRDSVFLIDLWDYHAVSFVV